MASRALCAALISGQAATALTAEEIESLSPVSPLPVAVNLAAVVANGSTVFAVSDNGVAAVSQNSGVTWKKAPKLPAAVFDSFSGLATNGALYVALRFGRALYSSDLQTWTQSASIVGQYEIVFAEGLFVTCGTHNVSNNAIRISSDGDNWSNPTSIPEGTPTMRGMAHGGGIFVAAGDDGTIIRSTDGQTWTTAFSNIPGRTGVDNRFQHVSYANSMFLATGSDALLYTSPDGVVWTARTPDTTHNLERVAFIDGRYIFANTLSSTFVTTDLATFVQVSLDVSGSIDHFAYAGGHLVCVGRDGYLGTTSDGLTWTERRVRLSNNFSTVAAGAGRFVTVDDNISSFFSSEDGLLFTLRFESAENPRTRVVFGNGRFLILGVSNAIYSSDGINWDEGLSGLGFIPDSLHFENGRFIALGRSGELAESSDGLDWTRRDTGSGSWLYNITYGEGLYVVSLTSNTLLTSPNLITWSTVMLTQNTSDRYSGVAYGDGRFIAAGRFTNFAVSEDGIIWTVDTVSNTYHVSTFGYDSEYGFYIHGTETRSLQLTDSSNLSSWATHVFPANVPLAGFAKLNDIVVGVGQSVLLSTAANTVGFNEWVLENFPGISDPMTIGEDADPDKDGQSNIAEYARGTNPHEFTTPMTIKFTRDGSGSELEWTHPVPPEDVIIGAEYSTNLGGWSSDNMTFVPFVKGDGTIRYVARVAGPVGLGPKFFMRITWTLNSSVAP